MSTSATHSKRHLDIDADEINADLNGTINTATTATTQSTSDNSTKVSTTAFVKAQGYITTQSDTQDLTQSGNTVSLVDGGSVDISTTTAVAANTSKTSFPGFDSTVLNSNVTLSSLGAQAAGTYSTATGVANDADVTPSWVPSSDPSYLTSSSTQTKYLRADTSDTATGFITLSGGVTGSNSLMTSFFLPQNPEGSHVKAPWFFNDMAYARLRGATVTVTVNGGSSPSNSEIDAMFDASTGFWNMATTGVSSLVIELTNPPKTMQHGAHYGVTFGNTTWRANSVDIDTYYSSGYQEVVSVTGNSKEFVYGAKNSSGNSVSKIKWTFSNFNTTSMRIVSLFAYNYNATGMPSLYLTKDGGEMYGAVDMNSNKITELGTPTANADAATKAYVDGAVIANTDTQDLSILGRVISLTDGGSVTVPETTIPTIPSGNQIIDWTSDQGSTNIHTGNYNNDNDNYYLDGITKSGNILTFSVNGGTNKTYTFGSNAFNSTTIPAAEQYTAHENISAATSVDGTGRAYIQDITVDSNGHVTGIATASETVTDTTYTVGNGGLTQNNFTDALKTSYDGAATHAATAHAPAGATVNSSNATLLARGNHTGTQSYDTISNPPTIPSGNAILDWTTDRGATNIHTGNYINTTYNKASSTVLGLVKVGSGLAISGAGVLSVSQAAEADEETGGAMSSEDKIKLNAIEESADVTDATNVAAAGASMKSATETISGAKTFSSTIAGSINGNSATTSERTITSGEISAISTNTSKVGITTGSQTIAGAKTFSTQIIGQTINLGSSSGYINRTAAQFATDGTDKVYIGSNNYGWNDARDYATNLVDVDAPVLDQNDQHCGIICPVNVSQVSIMSQVRMNAANGTMQVKVYKMARATAVNTSNLTLTLIASATVSTVNGRMTTLDATGSTAVSAGDLIIVGFGKTDGGAGQKPRFNFTLTGTTS